MIRLALVAFLAMAILSIAAQPALAGVSWCAIDLGPMATIAEERNAPQACHAEMKELAVPSVAVSVEKGGTNAHK